jgi:hypothetical protein
MPDMKSITVDMQCARQIGNYLKELHSKLCIENPNVPDGLKDSCVNIGCALLAIANGYNDCIVLDPRGGLPDGTPPTSALP